MALLATARVPTERASRYLQQLCKHFGHKLPVTFDAGRGDVAFPFGECALQAADDLLTITATAASEAELEQLKDVIARHLLRFAFREELSIDWG